MSKKGAIPDAWDDDWVNAANTSEPKVAPPTPAAKLSKAERRAQHLEQQKQLWNANENPGRNLWLEAQGVKPLEQDFKCPVTLLSRKPNPSTAKKAPIDGVANLNIEDGDDSEEEARKKQEADFEERKRKAKVERDEKQRKYAEARERIMGGSTPSSPAPNSRESSQGRDNRKTRSKINGGKGSQPESPANRSPTRATNSDPQLFDPNDMSRRLPRRDLTATPADDQPTRQPRGPEQGGRGGFGFVGRGGKIAG